MINDIIRGDLIELAKQGKFDAIAHGCNCFCAMGAGIAKQIKQEFPNAFFMDKKTSYGSKNKLGTYSVGTHKTSNKELLIFNCYTQFAYGGKKANVDYKAIEKCFTKLNEEYKGYTIGIPLIGSGLAKGDWDKIEKIINEATPQLDIILVIFEK